MSIKTTKIIYWISTLLLAWFILPGVFFMNSELAIEGMKNVWLTEVVRLQQLVWYGAPIAILAILLGNFFPKIIRPELKEWAYAGLGFIYIGAFWAHLQLSHTPAEIIMPIVTFVVLMLSHYTWHKLTDNTNNL